MITRKMASDFGGKKRPLPGTGYPVCSSGGGRTSFLFAFRCSTLILEPWAPGRAR